MRPNGWLHSLNSDWLKEARSFLSQHRAVLAMRPVAVFALGPTEDKEQDWLETQKQFDKALFKFPWLTPVAIELFGGRFYCKAEHLK